MNYPRTAEEWWRSLEEHLDDVRSLIRQFHPTYHRVKNLPITASVAEAVCEKVREGVRENYPEDPMVTFDLALTNKDGAIILQVLNQTWFGIPESRDAHSLPSFHAFCDLCSEGPDLILPESPGWE